MNTDTVRLFDHNDKLVPNFEEEIEKILISVHGENYYDTDEELVNTNEIPVVQEEKEEIKEQVVIKEEKVKKKSKFQEFIPVIFFMLLFAILIIAGYYFLNSVDLTSFIK